jgi:hypothetical protein
MTNAVSNDPRFFLVHPVRSFGLGLFAEDMRFGVEVGTEAEVFDEHAEDVFEGEVRLLDVHGNGGGDDDVVVTEGAHLAAIVTREADGGDVHFFGLVEGLENVGRVARGGDAEEDVAGLAEGFELAGEEVVEAEVVAGSGEDGGVGGEGDGAECRAIDGEADNELGDEVLGVGSGATVTGDEELVAGVDSVGGELGDGDEGVGDFFVGEDGLQGRDGLLELLLNEMLHGLSAWTVARVRDGWVRCRRDLSRRTGPLHVVWPLRGGYTGHGRIRCIGIPVGRD